MLGKNWKTFAAVGAAILVVGLEVAAGVDVPGVDLGGNWLSALLLAMGLGGIRDAIGKV